MFLFTLVFVKKNFFMERQNHTKQLFKYVSFTINIPKRWLSYFLEVRTQTWDALWFIDKSNLRFSEANVAEHYIGLLLIFIKSTLS